MLDEELTSLPVPTPEQTARFAAFVADNHSWYKHLPFFPPGACFVVYPHPHAGHGIRKSARGYDMYPIEQGDYFAHNSRLSTAEYLDRFGHWEYWVKDNPRRTDSQSNGPLTYRNGMAEELLTEDLKAKWSCQLTAFLKPSMVMFNLRPQDLVREMDAYVASRPIPFGGTIDRSTGSGARDPDPTRLLEIAAALKAGGSRTTPDLFRLMELESEAMRGLLLDTLQSVRAEWSEWQGERG